MKHTDLTIEVQKLFENGDFKGVCDLLVAKRGQWQAPAPADGLYVIFTDKQFAKYALEAWQPPKQP